MNLNRKIAVSMCLLIAVVISMNLLEYSYTNTTDSANINSTATNYTSGAVTEIFTKQDFTHGPQQWKPYTSGLPIIPDNRDRHFVLMFIDLYAAPIGKLPDLIDNGAVKVEYWFKNYDGPAAFHAYGYCEKSNRGTGIAWTNDVDPERGTGYYLTAIEESKPEMPEMETLEDTNHIYVRVANDDGAKYDDYGNDTYYINFDLTGGGLSSLHVTTDPNVPLGQVTHTSNRSGVFYISYKGGRGFFDNAVLMVAVDETIPDNFELYIRSSGYQSPRELL